MFTADDCAAPLPGVWYVPGARKRGLHRSPDAINTGTFDVQRGGQTHWNGGGNSGYQAINLAYHLGANRIVLLGYDMKAGPNGEKHWHADHGEGFNNPSQGTFAIWQRCFDELAKDLEDEGVPVINCTAHTALTCFRQARLGDVL